MNLCSLIALLTLSLLTSCAHHRSSKLPEEVTREIDFVTEVKPILSRSCLPCHHSGTLLAHFNLETREKAFRLGPTGRFIVPGSPESSRLWHLIATGHPERIDEDLMPSNGPRLTDVEKNVLYRWIEQGADWPDGEDGRLRIIQVPNEA